MTTFRQSSASIVREVQQGRRAIIYVNSETAFMMLGLSEAVELGLAPGSPPEKSKARFLARIDERFPGDDDESREVRAHLRGVVLGTGEDKES